MSDYLKYRGKCLEFCQRELTLDSTLELIRGHYMCPLWGSQEHWWLLRQDGSIFDPTVKQFPTAGIGAEYVPFDGVFQCEQCNKDVLEKDVIDPGNGMAFCSTECYRRCVGV